MNYKKKYKKYKLKYLNLKSKYYLMNGKNLKNVYGNKLNKCQKINLDKGSWDNMGYCSEQGTNTGLHQICFDVKNENKNFAIDTNQGTNWSENRINKNHCMCLGAYALYKTKQKKKLIDSNSKNELICDAIPDTVFNPDYVSNWNKWNGNEINEQARYGLEELVSQCRIDAKDEKSKKYLEKKYCDLANKKIELKSDFYKKICK